MSYKTNPSAGGYWMPGAAEYGSSSSSRTVTKLEAPGSDTGYHRVYAPPPMPRPQTDWPAIDDGVVTPETNTEYIDGEVRECMPANPEHSVQHTDLAAVLRSHKRTGYVVDTDLLTRQDKGNAFASDCCLRRDGIDDTTGKRYLEEVAFEVKATQDHENLRKRAVLMAARGVRRIFAIPVEGDQAAGTMVAGPLLEWQRSPDGQSSGWRIMSRDETITDPALDHDLPVAALLDAAQADQAIAKAVLASDHPVVIENNQAFYQTGKDDGYQLGKDDGYQAGKDDGYQAGKDDGYQSGKDDGRIETLRDLLHMWLQGHELDSIQAKNRINTCTDVQTLQRWSKRAVKASSLEDVFGDKETLED